MILNVTEAEVLILREMLSGVKAQQISFPNIFAPHIVSLQTKVQKIIDARKKDKE